MSEARQVVPNLSERTLVPRKENGSHVGQLLCEVYSRPCCCG